jgi:hypothetical protein
LHSVAYNLEETDEKTNLFRESAKVDGATALNVSVDIQSLIILDMNWFFSITNFRLEMLFSCYLKIEMNVTYNTMLNLNFFDIRLMLNTSGDYYPKF